MGYCSTNEEEGEEAVVPGPVCLEEGRVVDDGGQQSGESPEQQSREELCDDGILSKRTNRVRPRSLQSSFNKGFSWFLTLRYSTGLVTLNLSMVEMMMAGVVRKKSRMKRMQLMMKQRIHQEIPPSDRCSLQEGKKEPSAEGDGCICLGSDGVLGGWSLWTYQRTFCGSGAYETLQL